MTIKYFKNYVKMAISAILAGLALYSVSVMKSINDEDAYNRLSKKDKQTVDSLRQVGIEENELRNNIHLMSDALKTLQDFEDMLSKQKDWEKQIQISFPDKFNFMKTRKLNDWRIGIAQTLDDINKVNPKIFDRREIKTRLLKALEEIDKLTN